MQPDKNKVFKLLGKTHHYAWGGFSFIPELLNIANEQKKPFAEYWMGAHPNASAEIILNDGAKIKLDEYVRSFPEQTLGKNVMNKFGSLPYLFKILDVKNMLSIQVHPSKTDAVKEFAAENKKGIPLNAPNRNYKDDNHKPELMLALDGFWLLHGFKPENELKAVLKKTPELKFLVTVFDQGGYYELYRTVMEMDQEMVNETLQPLLDRIIPEYEKNELKKEDENFWAARAALTYNEPGRIDRGIFSIYLFNLVHVTKGGVVFQDAGLPHAYLEGQNVELMANSDNVLRGGLTPKHIDVHELLKHVKFEQTIPQIIHEKKEGEHIVFYPTPAPDFKLSKIELGKNEGILLHSVSAEIYIVMQGSLQVKENSNVFNCSKGVAFISFDKAEFNLFTIEGAVVYKASVPVE
ncbi:MAG TPA: mannose-6-phosphate isomerase, class I [Puia sp.]|nr:mannose-6-phosphate isomerase, class I [Puia sp.]